MLHRNTQRYDIPFVCAYSWRPGCCFHSCLCVCEDIKRPPWSYLESGAINNIQGIYWKFLSINNVLLQNKCVASMYPTLSWKPSLFFHISCNDKNSQLYVTLNDASPRFKSSSILQSTFFLKLKNIFLSTLPLPKMVMYWQQIAIKKS